MTIDRCLKWRSWCFLSCRRHPCLGWFHRTSLTQVRRAGGSASVRCNDCNDNYVALWLGNMHIQIGAGLSLTVITEL